MAFSRHQLRHSWLKSCRVRGFISHWRKFDQIIEAATKCDEIEGLMKSW